MAKVSKYYIKNNEEYTAKEFCIKFNINYENFKKFNSRNKGKNDNLLNYNNIEYNVYYLKPSLSIIRNHFNKLKEKNILYNKDVYQYVYDYWKELVEKYPFHLDYITMFNKIKDFYQNNNNFFNYLKFIRSITEYKNITFCDTETTFRRFYKNNNDKKIEDIMESKKYYKNNINEKPYLWAWISLNKNDDNYTMLNYYDTVKYFDNISEKTLQYYHNLTFDGYYITQMLIDECDYKIVTGKNNKKKTINFFTDENKRIYRIKIINSKNRTITLECTLLKLMSSVASLGKVLNYPKLDLDYDTYRSKNHIFNQQEIDYALADVTIVKKTMLKIEDRFLKNFGEEIDWKLTAGSTSKNLLISKYFGKENFNKLFEKCLTPTEWTLLKKAYQGGYSNYNIFYVGKILKNVSSLDIISCHPDKMQHYQMPFGKAIYDCNCNKEDYLNNSEHFKIYEITINNDIKVKNGKDTMLGIEDIYNMYEYNEKNEEIVKEVKSIDYLPFIKTGNILHYSQYKLKLLLLNFNINDNDITIKHLLCFKHKLIPELVKYMTDWEKEKEQLNLKKENPCYRDWCKLNMNGIYGKWAEVVHLIKMGVEYDKVININKQDTKDINDLDKLHYIPMAIAISDMARLMLFSMIETIGWKKWVNSDTDSCKFVNMSNKFFPENKPKYINLINDELEDIYGKRFGKWEKEYTAIKFKCAGKKKYIYTYIEDNKEITKVICAGANSAIKNTMNYDNFFVGFSSIEDEKTSKVMLNGLPVIVNTSFKIKNVFKSKLWILKGYKSLLKHKYYNEILRLDKLINDKNNKLNEKEIKVIREKEEYILEMQGEWS